VTSLDLTKQSENKRQNTLTSTYNSIYTLQISLFLFTAVRFYSRLTIILVSKCLAEGNKPEFKINMTHFVPHHNIQQTHHS